MTLPNKPTTTEAEREANRIAQARWRKTHFLLHAEYEKIVRELAGCGWHHNAANNKKVGRIIERAVKVLQEIDE